MVNKSTEIKNLAIWNHTSGGVTGTLREEKRGRERVYKEVKNKNVKPSKNEIDDWSSNENLEV